MSGLRGFPNRLTGFALSVFTWYTHRTSGKRYRAQAQAVAAWVVREVRKVIHGGVGADLDWELDHFQLFLARAIYDELIKNSGYYPISNSPHRTPSALFRQAVAEARIHPPDPVLNALPSMRIRIVPGWVKVYTEGAVQAAPMTLYPSKRSD